MIKARDMLIELGRAYEGMSEAQRAWLAARGIDKIAHVAAGGVGTMPVVAWSDGTFDWAGFGSEHDGADAIFNAVVIGVWSRPFSMTAPDAVGDLPELLDEVAFDPRDAGRWWRRARTAFALGECRLLPGGYGIDPDFGVEVRICATPMSWLAAAGGAAARSEPPPVCLLGPVVGLTPDIEGEETRFLRDVLAGAERLICDDGGHAEAVYKALRKRPKAVIPEVFVEPEREAA